MQSERDELPTSGDTTGDQFADLVRQRRSIRDFRSDPVPTALLDRIIADARWAPSWSNTQPYVVAVAVGAQRDRLQEAFCTRFDRAAAAQRGGWLGKARLLASRTGRQSLPAGDFPTDLTYPPDLQPYRRATGFGLYELLGIPRSDREARQRQLRRNFEFFGAPAALFLFVHAGLHEFAVLDAGAYLQTLLLSAAANGLGTCAQGALATWPQPVRDEFAIPDEYRLVCGVSVGFASDAPVNTYNPGRRDIVLAAPTPPGR